MRIKKYTASSMKEALLQIKRDLGEDAMILKTRKLPKKIFSFGDQKSIEVTAAIDDGVPGSQGALPPLKLTDPGIYKRPQAQKGTPVKPPPEMPHPLGINRDSTRRTPGGYAGSLTERFQILELREDIREMKTLLASILATGESAAAGGFAGPWAVLYKRLVDSEIKTEIAEKLVYKLKNTTDSPEKNLNKNFFSVLSDHFPVTGPLQLKDEAPRIIAFVGPTGSGKTTTIAKLASYYSLTKDNVVSIITADTYRIAAIEQIRAFTEIVDIGLQVVFSPDEVADALEACENDDIVFIDTAGRSQRNTEHMRDLESFLDVMQPDETHLVLSATTKDSDLNDTIKRYKDLTINRLLFTKLDETARLGNVFNIVSNSGIPVSYLTSGQSVPDDIELAQAGRFIQRLLEGSSL